MPTAAKSKTSPAKSSKKTPKAAVSSTEDMLMSMPSSKELHMFVGGCASVIIGLVLLAFTRLVQSWFMNRINDTISLPAYAVESTVTIVGLGIIFWAIAALRRDKFAAQIMIGAIAVAAVLNLLIVRGLQIAIS